MPKAPLIAALVLSGCTSQPAYINMVLMENVCDTPIEVETRHFSNLGLAAQTLEVPPGSRVSVGSYVSYGEMVWQQVPADFSLVTRQGAKQNRVGRAALIDAIHGAEFVSDRSRRQWLIRDSRLCPLDLTIGGRPEDVPPHTLK
jgi:hypothetical protein